MYSEQKIAIKKICIPSITVILPSFGHTGYDGFYQQYIL